MLLLDNGSTPAVRSTAARQLGALAGVRVSHPSADKHAHVNATGQAKLEDGSAPFHASVWRGIDGEWDQVMQLVARVRHISDLLSDNAVNTD